MRDSVWMKNGILVWTFLLEKRMIEQKGMHFNSMRTIENEVTLWVDILERMVFVGKQMKD